MSNSIPQKLAIDARSLDGLKRQAQQDPRTAAKQSARQIEAMFANMLISQLRKTSFSGESDLAKALSGNKNDVWRGMYDQQMAQTLAGLDSSSSRLPYQRKGLGLAEVVEKQLLGQLNNTTAETVSGGIANIKKSTAATSLSQSSDSKNQTTTELLNHVPRMLDFEEPPPLSIEQLLSLGPMPKRIQNGRFRDPSTGQYTVNPGTSVRSSNAGPIDAYKSLSLDDVKLSSKQKEFIQRFAGPAKRAEQATGIPAQFILGQAALESGWGKSEILNANGSTSHNLFGIKATGWKGKVANTMTREVLNGQELRMKQGFRAYDSYDHAFIDYAQLIAKNKRYEHVANAKTSHEFAYGLQKAGYATDPQYAKKLLQVIEITSKVNL